MSSLHKKAGEMKQQTSLVCCVAFLKARITRDYRMTDNHLWTRVENAFYTLKPPLLTFYHFPTTTSCVPESRQRIRSLGFHRISCTWGFDEEHISYFQQLWLWLCSFMNALINSTV